MNEILYFFQLFTEIEKKMILRQIKENRIYQRFCRKTRFSNYKNFTETKDYIKLVISNVIDGSKWQCFNLFLFKLDRDWFIVIGVCPK